LPPDRDPQQQLSPALGTPWGDVANLKERKLHPGSRLPREEVVRNQRDRLFGAAVAVVSEKGFETTTVADLIATSGVSRSDFYRHFANKAECVEAAAEALLEPTLGAIEALVESPDPAEASAGFERLVGRLAAQPAAARVCFVDLLAMGENGDEIVDRGVDTVVQLFRDGRSSLPGFDRMPPEMLRAVLGGLVKLLQTRIYRDGAAALEGLAPELWRWATGLAPPPQPLEVPRRQRSLPSAGFEGYTPAERIAGAVAAVVAEKGYLATNTDDVAARAAISLSTFYKHFSDKRDATLAALEMSGAQLLASAVPAARRTASWEEGVRALYETMCAYFAAEPAMAELALVGVSAAGPQALARRDRVIDSLTEMLAPGYERNIAAPAVSGEAIGACVYSVMRDQVRREGPESLPAVVPLCTYLTLVGFVGAERACSIANGESSP
jgi:AcrR family transcriptional regulator